MKLDDSSLKLGCHRFICLFHFLHESPHRITGTCGAGQPMKTLKLLSVLCWQAFPRRSEENGSGIVVVRTQEILSFLIATSYLFPRGDSNRNVHSNALAIGR